MPLAVELFSGGGSATRPFEEAGWRVVRLDRERSVRPTLVADVRRLPLRCRPDFLWASPPCETYSTANPFRRSDRALWEATWAAIRELAPKRWVIENVRGACRTWGVPAARWGPWFLWANFWVRVPETRPEPKMRHRDPRARARIPDPLARAVFVSYRDDQRVR